MTYYKGDLVCSPTLSPNRLDVFVLHGTIDLLVYKLYTDIFREEDAI